MHLVIDVGNTEAVVGLFSPDSLEPLGHWRYATPVPRTSDELLLLLRALLARDGFDPASVERAVVGSVVPRQTERLREALAQLGSGRVHVVDPEARLPIRLEVDEPRTVGADRMVNTLAAAQLYARDTIVVDLGTATTYDCITGEGVFLGGVIAPGLQAGQEWLEGHAAKLPRVELVPPPRVIGRRTESCLQSGIFYSAVDAVDGIVARIREEWERPEAFVVATGGYARVLAAHSRTVQDVNPHLTLVGLELAGRYMAQSRPSAVDSGSDVAHEAAHEDPDDAARDAAGEGPHDAARGGSPDAADGGPRGTTREAPEASRDANAGTTSDAPAPSHTDRDANQNPTRP